MRVKGCEDFARAIRLTWVKAGEGGSGHSGVMDTMADAQMRRVGWREVTMPKEHGSWPLAFEPVALGLLVAPSVAGAWVAVIAVAGFFARRPLKIVWRERSGARVAAAWKSLAVCAGVGLGALAAAVAAGGVMWAGWLVPFAGLGAVFLSFDLKNSGREEAAEIAGAAAFSTVAAAIAAAGGVGAAGALVVLIAMAGRAVPAVMFVRACVRGGKTGEYRAVAPLVAGAVALMAAAGAAMAGKMSVAVPLMLAVFLARATVRLLWPRPIKARTLGFQELAIGLGYLAIVAVTWVR